MAEADPRTVLSKEFKSIVGKMNLLGFNVLTALEKEAERSPSPLYAAFLKEFAWTIRTGGNMKSFFLIKTKQFLDRRKLRMEQFLNTLGLVGEMSVLLFTVFPLTLVIMLSLMAPLGGGLGGLDIVSLMYLMTFLVIPTMGCLYLITLEIIQPQEPGTGRPIRPSSKSTALKMKLLRPKTNVIVALLSPLFFILTLISGFLYAPISFPSISIGPMAFSADLTFPHFAALGVIFALIPPSIFYFFESKRKSAIDNNLPTLLRAIAEAGSTGIILRKAIKLAAEHNYGALTKELRIVVAQLSWKVPMEKALNLFGERCGTMLARTVVFLIKETNRIGGKTQESIETINLHIQELHAQEKRRRMEMQPQIGVIYIAFLVFLVCAYFLSVKFFGEALGEIPSTDLLGGMSLQFISSDVISSIFFYMAMVEGFFSGLAGGKLSTGSFKNGFIHAMILCSIGFIVFTVL